MIEPMKKVSIVLLNKEKEEALKALRKIGLVHLEKIEGAGEKLTAFKDYSNNAMLTEAILGEIKLPKQKKGSEPKLSDEKVIELCKEVVAKSERKKQLMEEISADTTELDRFAQWGSVCIEDLDFLKEKGIDVRKSIANLALPLRWAIYLALIMSVPFFQAANMAGFIYAQF